MDKNFIPSQVEQKLYEFWEKNGYFSAKIDKKKKPFCIILPPPNANANLHLGHALYVYEDVMIRYHKIEGYQTFWVAGSDHAGIETQFVFEKHLAKQDKSRFDFDRETLYQKIWDFVMENKQNMENQVRRLGFALDWTKKKFTLDGDIVQIVYKTFKDLYDKGLVYRDYRLVNYCTHCGTSFSDLEVVSQERIDPLYYMKYGPFTLATVRPETKFGDTAVAVNPKDKRYLQWIGKEVEVGGLLGTFKLKVIADEAVDPKFGTGVVKVTPAHDFNDYEMAKRHHIPMKQVIDFRGRLNELTGPYAGLKVAAARQKVVEDMKAKGMIVKVKEDYKHRVATCYRCKRVLEPLPKEQWFIKIKPLADKAIRLIDEEKIKIYPKRFKKQLIRILDNFIDWNISRQIVWGMRIPAYQCQAKETKGQWFISPEKPSRCAICGACQFVQDEDTFDTWFSSAQWPFATLQSLSTKKDDYFNYFYPTTVMETGYDILRAWVARMIMVGYFSTKRVPFENVFLHGMLRDKKGQKMSKSKGNVVNPLEMVDKYGADPLRAALIFGTKEGNDVVLSEDKIIGMRNFANKIWNVGRFIELNQTSNIKPSESEGKNQNGKTEKAETLKELQKELKSVQKKYHQHMVKYRFTKAFELAYQFLWHRIADFYIEELKDELRNGNMETLELLRQSYFETLRMIHPFMPFVTDTVWRVFHGENSSIMPQ